MLARTFTIPPTEAEQNVRRSGQTKRTSRHKTLAARLEESTNPAEIAFLRRRLSDPAQELSNNNERLLYRVAGKVRFVLRARGAHIHAIQRGRFAEDEVFWRANLSNASVGYRRGSSDLSFHLHSDSDFDFFERGDNSKGAKRRMDHRNF
jgi:hypothetical protein